MAWARLPLPVWLRWFGAVLGLCGTVLLIWTFRRLGHNLTDTVVTRRDAKLVTDGPYRWLRTRSIPHSRVQSWLMVRQGRSRLPVW